MTFVPQPPCAFERDAGRPCPVCRSIQTGTTVLQNTPAMDAAHVDHRTLAHAVDVAHAQQLYAERGLVLDATEVRDLSPLDRAVLDLWAHDGGLLPAWVQALVHSRGDR